MSQADHTWMEQALDLANQAFQNQEVPVGALLIRNDQIIMSSGNNREINQSPLGHAEAKVIQNACDQLGTWRLENTVLYVSMEPCLMCTGLIYAARIPKVVFGCKNPKGGSLQYIEDRRKELNLNHSVEIVGGILEKESSDLLKTFFKQKR